MTPIPEESLILLGDDKIGRMCSQLIPPPFQQRVIFDRSTNISRVLKLLRRGSMSPWLILKMFWAELGRSDTSVADQKALSSNSELLELIKRDGISLVLLFRAGLIISPEVIRSGTKILNIHCASLPEYGGVGSIARALNDKQLSQEATLHRVTARIDDGEILATYPYLLDLDKSYADNESIAYRAGIDLLLSVLADDRQL